MLKLSSRGKRTVPKSGDRNRFAIPLMDAIGNRIYQYFSKKGYFFVRTISIGFRFVRDIPSLESRMITKLGMQFFG